MSGFIDASDDIAKRCIERAAGNPLFLEQLLLNIATGSTESVPDSIKSLVLTRVDQLRDEDKQALQAASVLGQRFDLEGLRFLINNSDYACRELVEHHLVRPEGSLYLFAHALIREGAYASLLKRHRLALHRRAADWFNGQDLFCSRDTPTTLPTTKPPKAYPRPDSHNPINSGQNRAHSRERESVL